MASQPLEIWGADAGFRQAIEDGLIDGPRLQISIAMISQTGGHGDYWVPAGMRIPNGPGFLMGSLMVLRV